MEIPGIASKQMKASHLHLFLLSLVMLIVPCKDLPARDLEVCDAVEFQHALDAAGAGDTVVLAQGNWKDLRMRIQRGGSETAPLVIRAKTPGGTTLDASSLLEINAPHVVVEGLFFHGGSLKGGSVIRFNSHHGIVRECAVVDYNPEAFDTKYYWVYFSGEDNLLDRCYFKGKNNYEPLIGNARENSRRNTVRNCYFKNIPYYPHNGREILRIWGPENGAASDEEGAFFTISGNLFDHADGEGEEIVSLKSNHNRVLGNTVLATRGCLNIRSGGENLMEGNIVLGQGAEKANGLRISGVRNTVRKNYVVGCGYGIKVSTGEFIDAALTAEYKPFFKSRKDGDTNPPVKIAMYQQVKNLNLSDNVMVGNIGPDLEIGYWYKKSWPKMQMVLLPEECLIANNSMIRPRGGASIIGAVQDKSAPLEGFSFKPNIFRDNTLLGGKNDYAPAERGFKTGTIPSNWSEAQELKGLKILKPADVGPAWVVALRNAGKFPMEDDLSCERPDGH